MKKIAFTIIGLSCFFANGQTQIGFHSDNYSGVHGLISNPANIVDSRLKIDANVFSAGGVLSNDYYGVKFNQIFDGRTNDNFQDGGRSLSNDNNFTSHVDALGPAVMFNIDNNNAIAVFTRQRSYGTISNINGQLLEAVMDGFSGQSDFNITQGENLIYNENKWNEYGVTYATVFSNKKEHFFKGGITIKLLQGIENAYVDVITDTQDLSVQYDAFYRFGYHQGKSGICNERKLYGRCGSVFRRFFLRQLRIRNRSWFCVRMETQSGRLYLYGQGWKNIHK